MSGIRSKIQVLILAWACLALPLSAWAEKREYRVVTFNLYNRPWDRSARMDSALKTLRALNADLIALQEAATGLWLTGNPIEEFSSELKYHSAHHWHESNLGIFRTGLALLSRFPILESRYVEFEHHRFFDPKGFMFAKVKSPQGVLGVLNLHINSTRSSEIKQSQFEQLATFIASLPKELPVLILGDFNQPMDTPVFEDFSKKIEAQNLASQMAPERLHNTWSPDRQKGCKQERGEMIDYILSYSRKDSIRFVRGQIVTPLFVPNPSDHCPVAADFVFNP